MSNYIARHRRPRLSWRQRRSPRLTAMPQQVTLDAPVTASLFAPAPVARTGSA